jgi:hypothetical protein
MSLSLYNQLEQIKPSNIDSLVSKKITVLDISGLSEKEIELAKNLTK